MRGRNQKNGYFSFFILVLLLGGKTKERAGRGLVPNKCPLRRRRRRRVCVFITFLTEH